jgi:hypothetical protein
MLQQRLNVKAVKISYAFAVPAEATSNLNIYVSVSGANSIVSRLGIHNV